MSFLSTYKTVDLHILNNGNILFNMIFKMTDRNKYYETFSLSGISKSKLKNEEHANLYTKPKKDVISPHVDVWKEDAVLQADILEMPDDEGYRYILMVVELSIPKIDAEPLKNK